MTAPVLVYPASTTWINAGKPPFAIARLMARMISSLSDLGAALPPSRRNRSLRASLGLSLDGLSLIGSGWLTTAAAWTCQFFCLSLVTSCHSCPPGLVESSAAGSANVGFNLEFWLVVSLALGALLLFLSWFAWLI